jgi:hypothetical protein
LSHILRCYVRPVHGTIGGSTNIVDDCSWPLMPPKSGPDAQCPLHEGLTGRRPTASRTPQDLSTCSYGQDPNWPRRTTWANSEDITFQAARSCALMAGTAPSGGLIQDAALCPLNRVPVKATHGSPPFSIGGISCKPGSSIGTSNTRNSASTSTSYFRRQYYSTNMVLVRAELSGKRPVPLLHLLWFTLPSPSIRVQPPSS